MTTNDAAERLLGFFWEQMKPDAARSADRQLDAALAAERRATMERYDPVLRRLVAALGDPGGINIGTEMEPQSALVLDDWDEFDQALDAALAILDAEAEQ